MTYYNKIGEWAMKRYPRCYALLRQRGFSHLDSTLTIMDAKHGDRKARGTIDAMRRCEVFERQQADYDARHKRR